MGAYSVSLDLLKVTGSCECKANGQDGIFIPYTSLKRYIKDESIRAYINLDVVERRNPGTYGETHFLKVIVPKETYQAMTEEDRKNIPILGDMKPRNNSNNGGGEAAF